MQRSGINKFGEKDTGSEVKHRARNLISVNGIRLGSS